MNVFRSRPPARGEPGHPGASQRAGTLETQLDHLRAVLRMTSALTSTLNYERVLDMSLDAGMTALSPTGEPDNRMACALLLFESDTLYIASSRGLSASDQRAVFPGSQGLLARALTSGNPELVAEPMRDPELQRLASLHGCRAAVCIPLALGMDVFGALVFAHPNPETFSADRLELLEAVSAQAITALQNARLYSDLLLEKDRITEIHEEARKKLARDLHDGPTQSISAIAMRVNFARRLMERDARSAADELFKIEELARRTTKEIRQMLFTLRPLALESQGLVSALEQLGGKMKETYNQDVRVEAAPGVADDIEMGKLGVIFSIAEEAVNNARKHARANDIRVRLWREGDLLRMDVEDNGVGFDVAAMEASYESRGSLGMVNLHERAELVSGTMRIRSRPGQGTTVSLTMPLSVEAAERLHRNGVGS
jgi:signal transduction histidine kinase